MSGWLNSLGNAVGVDAAAALEQLKQQAEKIKEDASPALGAALEAVRTQAVKIKEEAVHAAQALQQAAEQANNEILAEQERVKASADPSRWADHIIALLPWEAEEEGHSILVQPLMEQVLSLPLDERNFQTLGEAERAQFPFKLENHVDVITRLLPLDPNLAKMHARLGSRMAEDEFWRAYFYRCACLRAAVGMGGGSNYPLIGEPLTTPILHTGGKGPAAEEEAAATGAAAVSSSKVGGKGKAGQPGQRQKERGQGVEEAKPSSSPSASGAGAGGAASAAAAAAEGKKDEGGEAGEDIGDDDLDGSLDLDGLDLGSEDGDGDEGLLEGDALKELEAQIAAELDAEGL